MRDTLLEQALRAIPGVYSVDVSNGSRGDGGIITVKDAVEVDVLTFGVRALDSDSWDCLLNCAGSMTYASEWDEVKVTAKIIYGFYYKACFGGNSAQASAVRSEEVGGRNHARAPAARGLQEAPASRS